MSSNPRKRWRECPRQGTRAPAWQCPGKWCWQRAKGPRAGERQGVPDYLDLSLELRYPASQAKSSRISHWNERSRKSRRSRRISLFRSCITWNPSMLSTPGPNTSRTEAMSFSEKSQVTRRGCSRWRVSLACDRAAAAPSPVSPPPARSTRTPRWRAASPTTSPQAFFSPRRPGPC